MIPVLGLVELGLSGGPEVADALCNERVVSLLFLRPPQAPAHIVLQVLNDHDYRFASQSFRNFSDLQGDETKMEYSRYR